MPVGDLQIGVLELHRRRKHDVGVLDRVRAEMLDDHREEVGARQSPPDFGLVWNAGERVAGVDEQRFHRRVVHLEQPSPSRAMLSERVPGGRRSSRYSAAQSPRKNRACRKRRPRPDSASRR